jgi:hypothetical protein
VSFFSFFIYTDLIYKKDKPVLVRPKYSAALAKSPPMFSLLPLLLKMTLMCFNVPQSYMYGKYTIHEIYLSQVYT